MERNLKSDDSLIFDHSNDDNARPKRVTWHVLHQVGSFLGALLFQNRGRIQYVIGITSPFWMVLSICCFVIGDIQKERLRSKM